MNKICIAVEANAANNKKVRIGQFICPISKQKISATDMFATYSPFSGDKMIASSSKFALINVKNIRQDSSLASVGICPTCQTEHFLLKKDAVEAANAKADLFCTLCSSDYKAKVGKEVIASMNDDENDSLSIDGDDNDDDETDNSDDPDDIDNDDDDANLSVTSSDEEDGDDEVETKDFENQEDVATKVTDNPDLEVNNADVNKTEPVAVVKEVQNPPPANEFGNDTEFDGEIVSANTKEFIIDCLASNGGFKNISPLLIQLNKKSALIIDDNTPVLMLSSDDAGENASLFENNENLTKAFQAIIASGNYDFSAIGAKPISFTVKVEDEINKKITAGIMAATQSLKEEKTTFRDELIAAIGIAASIINKNIEKDIKNPIREAMVEKLVAYNVKNNTAMQIVDNVLETTANDYISSIMNKTTELMAKPLTSRNEIGKFVLNSSYSKPVLIEQTDNKKQEVIDALSNGSVLISTAGTEEPSSSNFIASSGNSKVDNYRSLFRKR